MEIASKNKKKQNKQNMLKMVTETGQNICHLSLKMYEISLSSALVIGSEASKNEQKKQNGLRWKNKHEEFFGEEACRGKPSINFGESQNAPLYRSQKFDVSRSFSFENTDFLIVSEMLEQFPDCIRSLLLFELAT